jgi:hypothetical protein
VMTAGCPATAAVETLTASGAGPAERIAP